MPAEAPLAMLFRVAAEGASGELVHQLALTFRLLAALEEVPAVFLRRTYAEYDDQLTFQVEALAPVPPLRACTRARMPRAPEDLEAIGLIRRLREALGGEVRLEVFAGARLVTADPAADGARTPGEALRALSLDGADFAALRSPDESLIGVAIDRGAGATRRSVWCHITESTAFEAAVSALRAAVHPDDEPARSRTAAPAGSTWSVGGHWQPELEALHRFVAGAREVLGAMLLSRARWREAIAVGREAIAPDACIEHAYHRVELLGGQPPAPPRPGRARGPWAMVIGAPAWWCFGAELEGAPDESAWILHDRDSPLAPGWDHLAALARGVADLYGAAA